MTTIVIRSQNIFTRESVKMLEYKIEIHDFPHASENISTVTFLFQWVTEFNFFGLTLDCNLNFKSHLKIIGTKISRIIGLLHKLKYIFPAYLLRMIYNSLMLPHMNYSFLAYGSNCHSIELLQKKAVRVVNFKPPVAHTEPILKHINQLKLQDLYTFYLLKIYYKLYRNKLPSYFENCIPHNGSYHQNLRNNHILLQAIRCVFENNISKNEMHFRLRELAFLSNPPLYPNIDYK